MPVGEACVTVGNNPTLGPTRIEVFQPFAPLEASQGVTSIDILLIEILNEVRTIREILTRPPWWKRLWEKIKNVALFR
jgi:hypothetical protein